LRIEAVDSSLAKSNGTLTKSFAGCGAGVIFGVMSLIARGRLHRLVALILFSFALADLAYPQSCCDEFVNFFETAGVVSSTRAVLDAEECIGAPGSRRDVPSEPTGTQDECFCCCTHYVPTPHFDLAAPRIQSPPANLEMASLPSLSPHRIFHPPRIA
jgi:hypothetical protein